MFQFQNDLLEQDLSVLNQKLIEYLLTKNTATNQVLEHIFSTGGKRIRPALFFLSCQLLSYAGEHKFPIACVCEYIHTASLLHDDVIDNSTLRRNKATVNSIWGDETAILSGDLIYSTACRLMVKTKSLDLIDCFAECIRLMSESELFQLDCLWKKNTSYADYEQIVYGKTAKLFEASLKTVGFLNQHTTEVISLLGEFGKNLGFVFQIADDCLDYSGKSSIVGKPVATDLLEGKVTLPLIYALEKKSPQLEILVNQIMECGQASLEERQQLIDLVHENGGLNQALQKAESYAQLALAQLEKLKLILNLDGMSLKAYQTLHLVTEFALNRKN